MKIRSLFLGLLIAAALVRMHPLSSVRAAETNAEPAAAAAAPAPPAISVSDLEDLRVKLDAIQRANDLSWGRWNMLAEQNSALSNVLAGLQETLVSQKKREAEITEQARVSNNSVLLGAAAAVFLVFMASYWFQLRCMNRVIELSRLPPALPAPIPQALLEAPSPQDSRLLDAIKLLESRIRHLEAPANGAPSENGHAHGPEPKLIEDSGAEAQTTASKISLLLAKGEILLDLERYSEALTCFHEAVTMDPLNAEAHLKKGIVLERMNRLELSLSSYDEAVRLNPKRAFAYVHKARVLAALHRHDEALSVYDLALGKNAQRGPAGTGGNGARAAKVTGA